MDTETDSNSVSCNIDLDLQKVKTYNENAKKYRVEEKDLFGLYTHGAIARFYYDNQNLKLVEVIGNISTARFFTTYFFENNNIFYVESITDEWDLKKLYGEDAELDSSQGDYVVATSTTEGYVVSDNKLCKYISDKPRQKSFAVLESDPVKDFTRLINIYETINKKYLYKKISINKINNKSFEVGNIVFSVPDQWKIDLVDEDNVIVSSPEKKLVDISINLVNSPQSFGSGCKPWIKTTYGNICYGISDGVHVPFGISLTNGSYYQLVVDIQTTQNSNLLGQINEMIEEGEFDKNN